MTDAPRLSTVLLLWLMASLSIASAWKMEPGDSAFLAWVKLVLVLAGMTFAIWGLFTASDWITHHAADRRREWESARTYGMREVARAVEKLNTAQLDMVAAQGAIAITAVADESGPIFFVRGMTRSIPFVFVEEFLQASIDTAPFLYPVREASNKDWAQDITNLIIARGWAQLAAGPFAAKLTKPLGWVASKFGVELIAGEKND